MTDLELQLYINDINDSIGSLEKSDLKKISPKDLPSNLSFLLQGIGDSPNSLNFLFSNNLDKVIDKFFNMAMDGEFDSLIKGLDKLATMSDKAGIGSNTVFEGPIGSGIIKNIQNTVNSVKFQKMKIFKMTRQLSLVVRNLKKESKKIKDPVMKKKNEDAIYAIQKLIKVAAIVYRNRKIVDDRLKAGIKNIVTEDHEHIERLERIR